MAPDRKTRGATMSELLTGALGMAKESQDKRAQERAAVILRASGWQRTAVQREGGERVRRWRLASAPAYAGGTTITLAGAGGGAGGGDA